MQRYLRTLAHGTDKQGNANKGDGIHMPAHEMQRRCLRHKSGYGIEYRFIFNRTEVIPHRQNTNSKAKITDAIDNKGLHGGHIGALALEPEANQQIGEQTHRLPAEEQREEAVSHDQHQHGEGKCGDIGKESSIAGIAMHVADGVDMHAGRYNRHGHHHQHSQAVDHHTHGHDKMAGNHPRPEITVKGCTMQHLDEHVYGQQCGGDHACDTDHMRQLFLQSPTEQTHRQRRHQWNRGDRQ